MPISYAANQINEATEQRIIREQNRVIQNQQITIEVDQRKRESDTIEKQTSSITNKAVGRVGENQNLFPDPKKIKEGCAVINSSDLVNGVIAYQSTIDWILPQLPTSQIPTSRTACSIRLCQKT